MKPKNFNRELKGPDSYEYFNSISTKCQSKYLNLLKYQIIMLLIIAVISVMPVYSDTYENFKQFLNIFLMLIILFLMFLQFTKNYMEGWQKARFLAESILSNCWLLIFKCENYTEGDYTSSLAKFQARIKEMKKEVKIDGYLSISSIIDNDHDNPKWMHEKYFMEILAKKNFYLNYRMRDQIEWYNKKASFNERNSKFYFQYGLIFIIIGIALTTLILIKAIPNLGYLGFFTTLSASLFSWKQTKRFDELKTTYSVAAVELQDFRNLLERENDELKIKEIIIDTEKSISREHKLWFSNILT